MLINIKDLQSIQPVLLNTYKTINLKIPLQAAFLLRFFILVRSLHFYQKYQIALQFNIWQQFNIRVFYLWSIWNIKELRLTTWFDLQTSLSHNLSKNLVGQNCGILPKRGMFTNKWDYINNGHKSNKKKTVCRNICSKRAQFI